MLDHDRAFVIAGLVIVSVAAWAWIVPLGRDMYGSMNGPSAWMMTSEWDASHLALLVAMWIAMMTGMMLPSAAPALLLYANVVRKSADADAATARAYAFGAGYLVVWAGFSVAATALQRLLSTWLVVTPMMEAATPFISGVLLIIAGVYQLTPLKRACLDSCRSPAAFIATRWKKGQGGAFRLGLEHGWFCLGCCWALMLLLFAGGVMNLWTIGAITAFVLVEKIAPFGAAAGRVSGLLLVAAGLWSMTTGR